MPKTTPVCEELPPLPSGCIDVDTMLAAIDGGATGNEAVAAALVAPKTDAVSLPVPAPEPASATEPAPAPASQSDAEDGA